jgi:hypothetical protein
VAVAGLQAAGVEVAGAELSDIRLAWRGVKDAPGVRDLYRLAGGR